MWKILFKVSTKTSKNSTAVASTASVLFKVYLVCYKREELHNFLGPFFAANVDDLALMCILCQTLWLLIFYNVCQFAQRSGDNYSKYVQEEL